MLDMRGKKKKTTWEKNAAGDWLPRSPLGATRHSSQAGLKVTEQGRYVQRRYYASQEHLARAVLSMLPKQYRNLEYRIREALTIWGEENARAIDFRFPIQREDIDHDEWFSYILLNHKDGKYKLRYPEDTIRSLAKEIQRDIRLHLIEYPHLISEI